MHPGYCRGGGVGIHVGQQDWQFRAGDRIQCGNDVRIRRFTTGEKDTRYPWCGLTEVAHLGGEEHIGSVPGGDQQHPLLQVADEPSGIHGGNLH